MTTRFLTIAVGLALIITIALVWLLRLDVFLAWLVGLNLATLVAYGYDKAIAGRAVTRVPENVLLLLAVIGGSLGALVAMQTFRHKTRKASFRNRFWLILSVQVALVALYLWVS